MKGKDFLLTKRDFIKLSLAGAGSVALCGSLPAKALTTMAHQHTQRS